MSKNLKKAAAACILSAVIVMSVPTLASAATTNGAAPTIMVNGKLVQASGSYISANGQTFVNVASFAKTAGIVYTLNKSTNTVEINGQNLDVKLNKGVPYAYIRTLAAIAGATSVDWNGSTNTVQVIYNSKLVVYGDTVSQLGNCMVQNRFVVGDSIVFRMTALNSVTGKLEPSAKLQVHLSTGEVLDMRLGEHPPGIPNAEKFWTARYQVTDKTPKGTLNYKVTAETSSLKGEYKPFNVLPSLITIVAADQAAATDAPAGQ